MPYVGIKAAAERLGVSQDTIRRRIKAGELEGQQEPMGSGFRWLVEVPEEAQAAPADNREPGAAAADALELADARARIAGFERLIDELASDRDAWKDQARRSQVMAETAQRLAEGAQALALPAGEPEHTGTPQHGPEGPSGGHESLRERIRRLFGG